MKNNKQSRVRDESILLYIPPNSDQLLAIPRSAIQHAEGVAMDNFGDIFLAVTKAGYDGVSVDQQRLSDGTYIVAFIFDQRTIEGRLLQVLHKEALNGIVSNSPETVLKRIREEKKNEHCINNSAKEGGQNE